MKINVTSIKFKIFLYTLALGAVLIIYSLILYLNLHYVLFTHIDNSLLRKSEEIEDLIKSYNKNLKNERKKSSVYIKRAIMLEKNEGKNHAQFFEIDGINNSLHDKFNELEFHEDYVLVFDKSANIAAKSENIPEDIQDLLKKKIRKSYFNRIFFRSRLSNGQWFRVINRPVKLGDDYLIQVASSLEVAKFVLNRNLIVMGTAIPSILLFTILFGRFIVLRMVKPVLDIARTAGTIDSKNLNTRINNHIREDEINSLASAFNTMVSRMEESFRCMEEYSSMIAHELKVPLAIIRGELELALRKKRTPEEYNNILSVSLEETYRMNKTINELLLISELENSNNFIYKDCIDIEPFFKELIASAEIIAHEKNITLTSKIAGTENSVSGNKLYLRQLFMNLIDNSVKFTPRNGKIKISADCTGDTLFFKISDTGIGIPKENLPKIFDKFFHKNHSGESENNSAGLGLSIVKSIVNAYHGTIDVKSAPGKGSVFFVQIPLSEYAGRKISEKDKKLRSF